MILIKCSNFAFNALYYFYFISALTIVKFWNRLGYFKITIGFSGRKYMIFSVLLRALPIFSPIS